nr:hypothetical protein [Tanacetum cinerariifolium]
MHTGTYLRIPNRWPRAAPTGCSRTNTKKKMPMEVCTSCRDSPVSYVKPAVSALPILLLSRLFKRNSSARNGRRSASNLR